MPVSASAAVEDLYRSDWGRIVASLISLVGDFNLAEECAQEAFSLAVEQWAISGVPDLPRAWIVKAARNKAIDRIRRSAVFRQKLELYAHIIPAWQEPAYDDTEIKDDRLRLLFTCCHPSLALESQVALALRTLCGLQTDEIARAFLVSPAAVAQRIVRAKLKIKQARIPYSVPNTGELPKRLEGVLTAIYLVFNEGYVSTAGQDMVRSNLCREAIRLARLLRSLLPEPSAEAAGLLALMLLHDARSAARTDSAGDLVRLEDQDRLLWNQAQIAEALPLVDEALRGGAGSFALQAAIAALHCQAGRAEDTDWPQIVRLYDLLERLNPTPIIALNRAAAIAMAEGPAQALPLVDHISSTGELEEHHLLHAVRADLQRRTGQHIPAAASYQRALALVTNERERRFLESRLKSLLA